MGELSVFSNGWAGKVGGLLTQTHMVVYDGWVEDKTQMTDTELDSGCWLHPQVGNTDGPRGSRAVNVAERLFEREEVLDNSTGNRCTQCAVYL